MFGDELAEVNEELFQRGKVNGLAATHSLERAEDFGLLHQSARERGIERRQTERAVLEDLDKLTASAEQQHGSELRVDAAAEDEFVAVARNHRLDGHTEEVPVAGLLADGGVNLFPRMTDGCGVAHVEMHTAHVGLVRERLGEKFYDDGIA